ncbi:unnamed protein product, partial [Polarella glacialis]
VYHSEDLISDLRIRIRLGPRRWHGGALSPVPGSSGPASPPQDEIEEFGWQERVLGFHEVATGSSGPRVGRYLFSRVFPLGSRPPDERTVGAHSEDDLAPPTSWGGSFRCCRRRAGPGKNEMSRLIANAAMAEKGPLACDRMRLFAVVPDLCEDDVVAGALLSDERPPVEVLLCELRVYAGAAFALEVRPPLRLERSSAEVAKAAAEGEDGRLPYRFVLPGGSWFEFSVENASHVANEAERQRAAQAQRGFDQCVPQMRRNLAGSGFDPLGPEDIAHYSYVGEIVSFEPDGDSREGVSTKRSDGGSCDSLEAEAVLRCGTPSSFASVLWRPYFYAVCELSLPAGRGGEWEVVPLSAESVGSGGRNSGQGNMQLPIYTQCASLSGCHTSRRRCVFNQPLEVHLAQRQPAPTAGPLPDPMPPRLVIQLLSVDSWERQTLLGYAFADMPQTPGEHEIRSRLWAPLGSITHQLNAKLCGNFLPLASPHLVAAADMHERDSLPRNRSALRASATQGAVVLRLQVLRRRRPKDAPTTGLDARRARRNSREPGDRSLLGQSALDPNTTLRRRRRSAARELRSAGEPSPSPERGINYSLLS